MGVLADTTSLLHKYPITFLAFSAISALCLPVLSVSTAPALRPWAKRILTNALVARREAQRIVAESKEAYSDLLAEALSDAEVCAEERRAAPVSAKAVERPHRVVETAQASSAAISAA